MNAGPRTVACSFPPRPRRRASRPPRHSDGVAPPPPVPLGRVPRVARLLALALRLEQLVQAGVIANYAELARLGHVSRARVTQILNLRLLAPDLQEAVLFLPPTLRGGRDLLASTPAGGCGVGLEATAASLASLARQTGIG